MAERAYKNPPGSMRPGPKPADRDLEVPNVPFEGPWPELPGTYSEATDNDRAIPWLPGAKRWWNRIRRMPHAALWSDMDWEFAVTSVIVYQRFLMGEKSAGAELARREKIMGTTLAARQAMHIIYVDPVDEAPIAVVKSIDSVRDL